MIYDKYMQKCFRLAEKGRGFVSPNPLVGCIVLDKDNNIISKGYHHKYGENHAEREALLKLKNGEENGGTLIVNLEPFITYASTIALLILKMSSSDILLLSIIFETKWKFLG